MKFVSLLNEQGNFLSGGVPWRENVINIAFPFSRFCFALPNVLHSPNQQCLVSTIFLVSRTINRRIDYSAVTPNFHF